VVAVWCFLAAVVMVAEESWRQSAVVMVDGAARRWCGGGGHTLDPVLGEIRLASLALIIGARVPVGRTPWADPNPHRLLVRQPWL
jgi:hypothetical protein